MESGLSTLAVLGELVVDMSRVAFCDSGGLNALIRARLQAREAGAELHLLCPTGLVVDLLCRTRGGPGAARESGPCGDDPRVREIRGSCRAAPADATGLGVPSARTPSRPEIAGLDGPDRATMPV
ncbi:STAS domain-containing protein [Kitasatospora sp. NPDC059160]|uniref:STAS domain-containing protein n=1 Tax=Kitasatospora sp. NPDC059160 TaxID=3346748 RepID=UPI00367C86E1